MRNAYSSTALALLFGFGIAIAGPPAGADQAAGTQQQSGAGQEQLAASQQRSTAACGRVPQPPPAGRDGTG